MKVICEHRRRRLAPSGPVVRASSVSADVDQLLRPKTLEQLTVLERQVDAKLQSNDPIDVEYWEELLKNIGVYQAKARLKGVYKSVLESRLRALKEEQLEGAKSMREEMDSLVGGLPTAVTYSRALDPEPMLKINAEDKGLKVVDESEFLSRVVSCPTILCYHGYAYTRRLKSAKRLRRWVMFPQRSGSTRSRLSRQSRKHTTLHSPLTVALRAWLAKTFL